MQTIHKASGEPTAGLRGLVGYLAVLFGKAPAGQFVELRYRLDAGGMGQRFFDVGRLDAGAAAITVLSREHDLYIGAAPRTSRAGTRDAAAGGWCLWADCDDEASLARLDAFEAQPAVVVRSGSGRNCHAYWPLACALAPTELERGNRRIAGALGSDPAVSHRAAILRPPGSLNFKHDPPPLVMLERLNGERFEPDELLRALPQLERPLVPRAGAHTRVRQGDPLLELEPSVYVAALTGQTPGRDGKVQCPLHEDRTPSMHVYDPPEQGWYCFGCRRGGSVYDLGGAMLGLSTRGREFQQLRRRLGELLNSELSLASGRSRRGGDQPLAPD